MSRPSEVPADHLHRRVVEASHTGELKDLLDLFFDDAVLMPPNDTTLFGKEEIAEWWKEYFQWFQVASSVLTEEQMTVDGDQAFHRASVSVVIVPRKRGTKISDDLRSLTVWRRNGAGQWKIAQQLWNSTKPVGSGTNRFMSKMVQKKNS